MLGQTKPREDDGVIELNVRYIATTDNAADINTKNLSKEVHGRHAEALYNGRFPWDEDFPWILSEEDVERDGQTAYSVESLGLSAGAHSRPSKILQCDWTTSERSRNYNPNHTDMGFHGEADRIGFCDENNWIPVKWKKRRSAKALLSSTLQYSDTRALQGRNVISCKREATGAIPTLNGMSNGKISRRRHLMNEYACGKRLLSMSAMREEKMTNEKSNKRYSIVRSELG